jgi:hypothetical protein
MRTHTFFLLSFALYQITFFTHLATALPRTHDREQTPTPIGGDSAGKVTARTIEASARKLLSNDDMAKIYDRRVDIIIGGMQGWDVSMVPQWYGYFYVFVD